MLTGRTPFQPGVSFQLSEEYNGFEIKPVSEMKKAGAHPSYPPNYEVKHFDAYIGGCISYTYGGDFHGETGFLYKVNVHPAGSLGNPYSSIVPEIGKDIPLDQLAFYRYVVGGGEWAR